jgi:hypothetical protein
MADLTTLGEPDPTIPQLTKLDTPHTFRHRLHLRNEWEEGFTSELALGGIRARQRTQCMQKHEDASDTFASKSGGRWRVN